MIRLVLKRERGECIERLKDVANSGKQGPIECRIEEVFLLEVPGDELFASVVSVTAPPKEPLGNAVLDFVGVGERFVFVKANEAAKLVHPIDIVVGHFRLDSVFPLGTANFKNAFKCGRANVDGDFFGGAGQGLIDQPIAADGFLFAIAGGAQGEAGSDPEPGSPMKWKHHAGRYLAAPDK